MFTISPKLANKAVDYVSASSNLKGTVNEIKANRMLRDAQQYVDKDTLFTRVASLRAAKAPLMMEKPAPKVEIIPENSINFFG